MCIYLCMCSYLSLKPQPIGLTLWDVSDWLRYWNRKILEEQAAWECGNGDFVARAAVKLSESQPQTIFQLVHYSKDWTKPAMCDKYVNTDIQGSKSVWGMYLSVCWCIFHHLVNYLSLLIWASYNTNTTLIQLKLACYIL